jgi:hypothetical protein
MTSCQFWSRVAHSSGHRKKERFSQMKTAISPVSLQTLGAKQRLFLSVTKNTSRHLNSYATSLDAHFSIALCFVTLWTCKLVIRFELCESEWSGNNDVFFKRTVE